MCTFLNRSVCRNHKVTFLFVTVHLSPVNNSVIYVFLVPSCKCFVFFICLFYKFVNPCTITKSIVNKYSISVTVTAFLWCFLCIVTTLKCCHHVNIPINEFCIKYLRSIYKCRPDFFFPVRYDTDCRFR